MWQAVVVMKDYATPHSQIKEVNYESNNSGPPFHFCTNKKKKKFHSKLIFPTTFFSCFWKYPSLCSQDYADRAALFMVSCLPFLFIVSWTGY